MAKRFLKWFRLCTPTPRVRGALKRVWGASRASNVRLGKKFIKQKLQGRTILVGADPDLEGPGPHVLLEPWSIIFRQSLQHKSCSVPSQQSTWSVLDLLDLARTLNQGSGALNRAWSASTASTMQLGEYFIKQKLQASPVLVGADHVFGPVIWIWKDLGPMCFRSHGQSFSGKVY